MKLEVSECLKYFILKRIQFAREDSDVIAKAKGTYIDRPKKHLAKHATGEKRKRTSHIKESKKVEFRFCLIHNAYYASLHLFHFRCVWIKLLLERLSFQKKQIHQTKFCFAQIFLRRQQSKCFPFFLIRKFWW